MKSRTIHARWAGGLRSQVQAGRFPLVVDEPETAGGSDLGPAPTDLLLASVGSCFTLALAYTAAKRGIEVRDIRVTVTGIYAGMRFGAMDITVAADVPMSQLRELVEGAERVCYVTNTLRNGPQVTVSVAASTG
jgi:putative redox protein